MGEKIDRDINEFVEVTNEEDELQIILRGHLYIEHELEKMLSIHMVEPQLVLNDRFLFMNKLNLAVALGLLPLSKKNPYKKLNDLRNKYVHKLKFKMDEKELNGLVDSLDKDLRKEFFDAEWSKKYKEKYEQRGTLKLQCTVLSLWTYAMKIVYSTSMTSYSEKIKEVQKRCKDHDDENDYEYYMECVEALNTMKREIGIMEES